MRPCPYCGKEIQDEAIVCRYCGLDVERPDWLKDKHRCPFCAEWIGRSLTLCPYCKSDLTDEAALFEAAVPEPSFLREVVPEPPEAVEEPQPEDLEDLEHIEEMAAAFVAEEHGQETHSEAVPPREEESEPEESGYYSSGWAATPAVEEPMRAVPLDKSGRPKVPGGVEWLQFDVNRLRQPALIGGAIIVLLAIGVGGAYAFRGLMPAAAPATATPKPSSTPRPTVAPTNTNPAPSSTAEAVATSAANCVEWDQVSLQDARKTMCVYGVVKRWFAAGDLPFVVIFSEEPGTFALVDREQEHSDVRPGECIRGEGEIEVMSGTRPFIDIQGTILPCP